MLTVNDPSVIVPPVPAPRKNKRVIHGKFTVMDLLIVVPCLIAAILIMIFCKMPIWGFFLTAIAFLLVGFFLCWPLSFLGKDKPYMYIVRGCKFLFGSHRNLQTEAVANSKEAMQEPNKTNLDKQVVKDKKENKYVQQDQQEQPKDLLSRIFAKRKARKEGKK